MAELRQLHDESVLLEQIKVGVQQRVTDEVATTVRLSTWRDHMRDELVYRLTAFMLGEQLPPETIIEHQTLVVAVPASPWQQYKQSHATRWWMRWLVRRRPVREVDHTRTAELRVDLRRYWAYPQAKIAMAERLGRPIRVAMTNTDVGWEDAGDDDG